MRLIWIGYFILVTVIFFVLEFPREEIAHYYLAGLESQTGLNLVWEKGDFGVRSAHLNNVTVVQKGQGLIDLDTLDADFGLGSVDFTATRGTGSVKGTWSPHEVTFQSQLFPLPAIQADWLQNITVTAGGQVALPTQNGDGTLELRAQAGRMLSSLPGGYAVSGTLQSDGTFRLEHGNLELHSTVLGDKLHGRLDLVATRVGDTYDLSGTFQVELNGQNQTFRISGTAAQPRFTGGTLPGAPALPPALQMNRAPAPPEAPPRFSPPPAETPPVYTPPVESAPSQTFSPPPATNVMPAPPPEPSASEPDLRDERGSKF